jgi:hypothetical protein
MMAPSSADLIQNFVLQSDLASCGDLEHHIFLAKQKKRLKVVIATAIAAVAAREDLSH